MTPTGKPRRYTPAERAAGCELARALGSQRAAGRQLGVHPQTVNKWIRQEMRLRQWRCGCNPLTLQEDATCRYCATPAPPRAE